MDSVKFEGAEDSIFSSRGNEGNKEKKMHIIILSVLDIVSVK